MADSNKELAAQLIARWESRQDTFSLQTSGSTGQPKAFTLQRERVIASCEATGKALNIQPEDSVFCALPVCKIAGWMQVVRALVWKVKLEVAEPSSNPLAGADSGCSITSLTAMQLFHILHDPISLAALNRFRVVLIGGGSVSESLEQSLANAHPVCYHTYGMTETYSHIALRKLNSGAAFQPLPGINIRLNDSGCLCISGDVTGGDWLETNDIATLTDGGFVIHGRIDNVINSGGIKIQAEQIELQVQKLLQIPEGSFVYFGIPDELLGEKPALIYNPKLVDLSATDTNLFQALAHAKPRMVEPFTGFEYAENGKVLRQKTIDNFLNQ